jgi:DNA (cytosine-5)-methyltransferase 1
MLEDNVDEKYYIEDELLQHIIKTKQEHTEYTQYDRYNGEFEQLCRVWKDKSPTLHTKSNEVKIYGNYSPIQTNDLRIRKLTPKECFRLMGVKDKDYDKVAKNQSNASLYHLAGDSIVVNVLMAIFKEML